MEQRISKVVEMVNSQKIEAKLLIEANNSIIDCLTDTYFIKTSIIRLLEKCPIINDKSNLQRVSDCIKHIDHYVTENQRMIEEQKKAVICFRALWTQDYQKLFQSIWKIDSLLEKINNLKWSNFTHTKLSLSKKKRVLIFIRTRFI